MIRVYPSVPFSKSPTSAEVVMGRSDVGVSEFSADDRAESDFPDPTVDVSRKSQLVTPCNKKTTRIILIRGP